MVKTKPRLDLLLQLYVGGPPPLPRHLWSAKLPKRRRKLSRRKEEEREREGKKKPPSPSEFHMLW
jgi:hypothetical protein